MNVAFTPKRCVEKKHSDVYIMFSQEVSKVRSVFEKLRNDPPLGPNEPVYAGAALWANSLGSSVKSSWSFLESLWYLPKPHDRAESEIVYQNLLVALHDFKMKKYADWITVLDGIDQNNLNKRLDLTLMVRAMQEDNQPRIKGPAFLHGNFDKSLLKLFSEVRYWEQVGSEVTIPYVAHGINNQRERVRILREYVMLVVRDYNQILTELSSEEKRLFEDIIRRLDRRIQPGLQKLTWQSKNIVDWYYP